MLLQAWLKEACKCAISIASTQCANRDTDLQPAVLFNHTYIYYTITQDSESSLPFLPS